MKRIGILGGMMPDSTVLLYETIITNYVKKFGNHNYPEIVIFSVNFDKVFALQESGNVNDYVNELTAYISFLKKAGAEFAVIASNSPHVIFDELQNKSSIPLLSIVKVAADEAKKRGLKRLLLLGTRITMESNFYHKEFEKQAMEIITPSENEQKIVTSIIDNDLIEGGTIKDESRKQLIEIINSQEVDGVILGCTELPIILSQNDLPLPLLNTTNILAEAALNYACL